MPAEASGGSPSSTKSIVVEKIQRGAETAVSTLSPTARMRARGRRRAPISLLVNDPAFT